MKKLDSKFWKKNRRLLFKWYDEYFMEILRKDNKRQQKWLTSR